MKTVHIVLAVIALVAGLGVGYMMGLSAPSAQIDRTQADQLQGELEKMKAQIEKAKQFFPPSPQITSISGSVKSVEGDIMTVEASLFINPFEELPTMREVLVTEATKIIRNEPKDSALLQKENEAYQKALKEYKPSVPAGDGVLPSLASSPTPPQLSVEKEVALGDVKAGDQVFVDAGKNIKTEKRFEAVRIVVQMTTLPAGAMYLAPVGFPVPAPVGTPPAAAPLAPTPQP